MSRRSPWGSTRRLPSGRFQARYRVGDVDHLAPTTFATKRDAEAYLAGVRTDLERGTWIDVDVGKITLAEYSTRWLQERTLRPRTVELYEGLLRLQPRPQYHERIGFSSLGTYRVTRQWRAGDQARDHSRTRRDTLARTAKRHVHGSIRSPAGSAPSARA